MVNIAKKEICVSFDDFEITAVEGNNFRMRAGKQSVPIKRARSKTQ